MTMVGMGEFIGILRGMEGVIDVAVMDRDEVGRIVAEEMSITEVSCGIRMECPGMNVCASKGTVFALSCDVSFPRPTDVTMELVDDRGVVIGHDVPPGRKEEFGKMGKEVIWVSDSFVLYPEKVGPYDVRMVLGASRMDCGIPYGPEPWIYYPSMTSAVMMNGFYGFKGDRTSTVVLGVDGLS